MGETLADEYPVFTLHESNMEQSKATEDKSKWHTEWHTRKL